MMALLTQLAAGRPPPQHWQRPVPNSQSEAAGSRRVPCAGRGPGALRCADRQGAYFHHYRPGPQSQHYLGPPDPPFSRAVPLHKVRTGLRHSDSDTWPGGEKRGWKFRYSPYGLLGWGGPNCEHVSHWVQDGRRRSKQAELGNLTFAVLLGAGVAVLLMKESDNSKRISDVVSQVSAGPGHRR